MTIAEMKKMTTTGRLQIMEELWDSLCHDTNEIESPEWHGDILEERKIRMEKSKVKFISLEDLKTGTSK